MSAFCSAVCNLLPDERRVAEDVGALLGRQDGAPVDAQGVADDDVRRGAQRQALVELAEGLGERDVGLVVGQPEGDLGDAGGEFLDLDAVELVDVDLGELVHVVERHFVLAGREAPAGLRVPACAVRGR